MSATLTWSKSRRIVCCSTTKMDESFHICLARSVKYTVFSFFSFYVGHLKLNLSRPPGDSKFCLNKLWIFCLNKLDLSCIRGIHENTHTLTPTYICVKWCFILCFLVCSASEWKVPTTFIYGYQDWMNYEGAQEARKHMKVPCEIIRVPQVHLSLLLSVFLPLCVSTFTHLLIWVYIKNHWSGAW